MTNTYILKQNVSNNLTFQTILKFLIRQKFSSNTILTTIKIQGDTFSSYGFNSGVFMRATCCCCCCELLEELLKIQLTLEHGS